MVVFYSLNMALYLAILVAGAIYFTRYFKLGWLNPLTIPAFALMPLTVVTAFAGPIFVLPDGWQNPYFQYALFVDNSHSLISLLALIFLVRLFTRHPVASRLIERLARTGGPARPARMRIAALIFLGLAVVCFVMLAQSSFGVLNWLKDPRTGYQLHRTGAGQWYALCITFVSVSVVLATTYARSTQAIILMAPFYLWFANLFGSKSLILVFALYIVTILAIRHYKYLKQVTVVIGGAAVVLVASNFISTQGSFSAETISGYSDYYVNAALYYEKHLNGDLPLYQGEIFLTSFWGLVPRSLYPDKPFVYGDVIIDEVFYPGAAEKTNTPAFATVDYFADFGWLGVFLSGLFGPANVTTAFLYTIVLARLNTFDLRQDMRHSRVLAYLYLMFIGPAFLLFFEFPLNFILLGLILGIIEVVNRMRLVSVAPSSPELSSAA